MRPYYETATPEERAPYDEMVRVALAMPPSDERRRPELARLCRVGAYRPRPTDWPEFSPAEWRDGKMVLRGRGHGLKAGEQVCVDRENFANVWTVLTVEEYQVEADDWEDTGRMVWRTMLDVEAFAINGDYAVLPGHDTVDLLRCIEWFRTSAEIAIRKI